jgi:hypothetical protein
VLCRLEGFVCQANRVAGFSGLNLFFLSYLKMHSHLTLSQC